MAHHAQYLSSCKAQLSKSSSTNRLASEGSTIVTTVNPKSTPTDLVLRFSAGLAGAAIITAGSYAAIDQGHLTGSHAAVVATLAAGCIAGSLIVSRTSKAMAIAVVLALFCGEAFNLLSTGERVVAHRESLQAAARDGTTKYMAAETRLSKADFALRSQTSKARETVATKDCRKNCRALLDSERESLESELASARQVFGTLTRPASGTPLADRIGWHSWVLDLLSAGLLSLGSNALGAVLIAWASRPSNAVQVNTSQVLNNDMQLSSVDQKASVIRPVNNEMQMVTGAGTKDWRNSNVIQFVTKRGGEWRGRQNDLAAAAGISQATVSRVLRQLAREGLIDLVSDRQNGTRVRLRVA